MRNFFLMIDSHQFLNHGRQRSRKEIDNLVTRKKTLPKKAYELRKYYDIDGALIIHKNSQYITYRLIDLESFPPVMKEIVMVLFFLSIYPC
jgi:hypothetical protein